MSLLRRLNSEACSFSCLALVSASSKCRRDEALGFSPQRAASRFFSLCLGFGAIRSEAKCCGIDSVYRVALDDGLGYVAVKTIRGSSRKLDQELVDSFLAEVEILRKFRHNNIVKLMCCISSDDLLLLAYEYHEHQSLDRWLHKKNKTSVASSTVHHDIIDWPKRLHIAIGAAQGLCYLYNDCSPPIIHRDVKASNIVLDSQFNAKVADFGFAKILIKPEELATMSPVAGTFGYIAPEYAQSIRVNEKMDVYSFGAVLLELTTGKEVNPGYEYSSLAE
ncbi:hypothetical protein KIW84_061443 [Lathyrus oleraceus]|uniref:non-specific serine/threonine protein kinase n=1 Tax=Pisum sativum TaxID=3888 RepID=A0A9D4W3V3_PEA|nr:hypothetical protein KIW84_061443 [Pisum sativum]